MQKKGKPVVAVNSKGEVVGAYRNVQEAARVNSSQQNNIYKAISQKTYHKKVMWMWEEEYRTYWMEGRTDELRHSYREWKRDMMLKHFRDKPQGELETWKKNISASRKEYVKTHPDSMPCRRKKLLCVTTGEIYQSAVEFARKHDTVPSNVSHAARTGHRVKGMVVKFINV